MLFFLLSLYNFQRALEFLVKENSLNIPLKKIQRFLRFSQKDGASTGSIRGGHRRAIGEPRVEKPKIDCNGGKIV
ncbi:hypothetical protein EL17_20120 [Anditalea andensis]|uniref:Uncharacterized protein n=1 Tax=Anditalea andensis TaxID=1048983 RepID=A0A074LEK9_9BACT|nr:hypothetical protein EL17_20120 [Anditalea andensis]